MKFLAAILLTLLTCLPGLAAAPRFALVRVTEIYRDLPSTAAVQKKVKAERDALLQDERANMLRKTISELQAIQARLQDKTNPPGEEARLKLGRDYELKRQEAQTLQREYETFSAEQTKRINRMMVEAMRDALNRIHETSGRLAEQEGFDGVFDSSGETNTGVPFILYSKDAPDLTDKVKAALANSQADTPTP